MNSEKCMFNRTCKNKDTDKCNKMCFPFVVLHGTSGEGGFWRSTGVPSKYQSCLIENLPIKTENPNVYMIIEKYINNVEQYVKEKSLGLFLFSIPNNENKFGTGTGKTTTAVTILNEFVVDQVKKHVKGSIRLETDPALFIKASEFQNKYNEQFRGSQDLQKVASNKYYSLKKKMKDVDLLVLDDIAIRDTTEAFKSELFEIIDHRATEGKTMIFTSNYPLEKVAEMLGDRIVSRIEGMCYTIGLKGKDHRKDWRI